LAPGPSGKLRPNEIDLKTEVSLGCPICKPDVVTVNKIARMAAYLNHYSSFAFIYTQADDDYLIAD
jgi:hypothetical protein